MILSGFVAMFSGPAKVAQVPEQAVLQITLDYSIAEQTRYEPTWSELSFSPLKPRVRPGLYDIVQTIEKAREDPRMQGIFLQLNMVDAGLATLEQIRHALERFRESGKFVIVYAELYTERAYYLASVADKVFVHPQGFIEFNGFNVQYVFFRRMLEKFGVEPQVFYAGEYKTASEPFRLDSMSQANEMMTSSLLNDIYGHCLHQISRSRLRPVEQLDSINRHFVVRTAYDALRYGLADSMLYRDQVISYLKQRLGVEEEKELPFVSLTQYLNVPHPNRKTTVDADRIALLFAQGDIVDGKGSRNNIGSARFAELLRKLLEDKRIKAVVLRVNSGGGSALASDVIAREVQRTAIKKPLIVSMGDYAASGGYYVSAYATRIMAVPTTLTGSIGVFGIWFNTQKLFKDKLGISFDQVQTGRYSDFGNPNRPLSTDEKRFLQQFVDTIYHDFKHVVAVGRNMTVSRVDSLAKGRVWTGNQALHHQLVDTLGGVLDAVALAAQLIGSTNYRVVQYPEPDSDILRLMMALGEEQQQRKIKQLLGPFYAAVMEVRNITDLDPCQARMPALPVIY